MQLNILKLLETGLSVLDSAPVKQASSWLLDFTKSIIPGKIDDVVIDKYLKPKIEEAVIEYKNKTNDLEQSVVSKLMFLSNVLEAIYEGLKDSEPGYAKFIGFAKAVLAHIAEDIDFYDILVKDSD